MTYCVAMALDAGMIFASDSRTNAGVDQIARFSKMRSFVRDGELVIGWDDRCPAFFWLAAQGGYGIQSAAGVAELAASLLCGEPLPPGLAAHGVDPLVSSPHRLR